MRAAWKASIPLTIETRYPEHSPPELVLGVAGITGNRTVEPLSEPEMAFLGTIVRRVAKSMGVNVQLRERNVYNVL